MNTPAILTHSVVGYIRFDLDQTLIQSLTNKRRAVYATLYHHLAKRLPGLIFDDNFTSRTDLLAIGKKGLVHGWQELLGYPEAWVDEIYAEANAVSIYDVRKACKPDSIVNSGLEKLREKGYILALHSHGGEEYCVDAMHGADILRYFPEATIFHKKRVSFYKDNVEAHNYVKKCLFKEYGMVAEDIMVDDMIENLWAAHYSGSQTCLNGAEVAPDDDRINLSFPHIHQTLAGLNARQVVRYRQTEFRHQA